MNKNFLLSCAMIASFATRIEEKNTHGRANSLFFMFRGKLGTPDLTFSLSVLTSIRV